MNWPFRLAFILVILVSILMRQASGKGHESLQFLDRIEEVIVSQGGEIIATRKTTQMNGFVTFVLPSCPSNLSVVPFYITQSPVTALTVQGFESARFSVAYLDYWGPYPGKFRLFLELLQARVVSSLGLGNVEGPKSNAVLIVSEVDCDLFTRMNAAMFWQADI